MPVSIPLILATTQLAIDSCDPMNLDTGDISNTGKSTAAQTNLDSKIAQTKAIEASSETFKTLGDLTQLLIPIRNEFVYIVSRINSKLRPYEEAVERANKEFAQILDSETWYVDNIALKEQQRDDAIAAFDNAQTALDALDPESATYAADSASLNDTLANQESIRVSAVTLLDQYDSEVIDLANNKAGWVVWQDYHQAVIDDIISTFNTIMAPVRSAFSAAKSAIETSNSNISTGKNQMLDGAALIAKTLAKTASAAVTQAIGDIAENSNIMAPVDSPADTGGGSIDLTGWPSFRGAKDTQQFLGPVWDGVTVPPHVELRKTQIASVSYNSAGEFSVMEFGPTITHIYQPNYPNVQELVPDYVGGGMRWLPQAVDGKIHAYPIVLSNKFILGNERYDQAYNSPAGGPLSRGHRTIHWYSWLPGGEPMKDVNGMPVVISQMEGPQDSFYQLYSVTDRARGEERFIDPAKSEYNRGKIVIPIVNQTMFLNTVTVPMALGDALITVGIGRTNVNGRAPTASELTVIDVEEFGGVRSIAKQLPAGFIIRRSNTSGDAPQDQNRIKSFDDYISTNKVTLEPQPDILDYSGTQNTKSFKNQRQLRGANAAGSFTNIVFDMDIGRYELTEEPNNTNTTYGNKKWTMVRVALDELKQFFYGTTETPWSRSFTQSFFVFQPIFDPRMKGTSFFAPAIKNKKDIEYKFRDLRNGSEYLDGDIVKQGDTFTSDGVTYARLLIYHSEDQGYPNTNGTINKDESFGPMKVYDIRDYYFGYVDASDVENIEYLPWKAAQNFGFWGASAVMNDDSIFISQASNISVAKDYHHDYLKVEKLQYAMFAGKPVYRLWFERNGDDKRTFDGLFDSTTDLVIAQEKTAEETAQDNAADSAAGTLGEQPFIATDSVLTYDTAERATADFEAGLYPSERLIRINNFRRSEDLGLGELFIVQSPNWIPVNEWEENWRKETGGPVDVEEYYNVINNVIGLRPDPLDVDSAKPSMPAFDKPTTSKTIRLGDRTVDLGPMHPFTDLISGADAYERATKAHFEDITPFVDVVENSQTVATIKTSGLGGFDEEKVNAKKLAEAVTEDVKKIVNTAEDEKDKAKFDFATVTENLTSVNATSTAISVKSAAEAGTSLMSNARTSVIPASSTAFPRNEQLIARPEPPILPEPFDITSGGRIPS